MRQLKNQLSKLVKAVVGEEVSDTLWRHGEGENLLIPAKPHIDWLPDLGSNQGPAD